MIKLGNSGAMIEKDGTFKEDYAFNYIRTGGMRKAPSCG